MPSRSPQQEEQLRALKLERDFERRAEEAKQEDEEEGEEEPAVTVSHQSFYNTIFFLCKNNFFKFIFFYRKVVKEFKVYYAWRNNKMVRL